VRRLIECALLLLLVAVAEAQTVRIGVLGLFHPKQLRVTDRTTGKTYDVTLGRSGALVRSNNKQWTTDHLTLNGDVNLSVPGKITRRYAGELTISPLNHELLAIVTIDLESAVIRIVKSESLPGIPIDALRAQAIVTRSYLLAAKGRHIEFDFCDTTHCQFFGDAPDDPGDPVVAAVRDTRGMVLTYGSQPLGAMFSKSCGGSTRSAKDIGMAPGEAAYPYYVVETTYCLRHPDAWRRSLPKATIGGSPQWGIESFRLAIGRILGWNAMPSNHYTVREHIKSIELRGTGRGHGLGLCQRGAAAMAAEGRDFRAILAHYYPNTKLESLAP
jgi:stage II sporulation protein D